MRHAFECDQLAAKAAGRFAYLTFWLLAIADALRFGAVERFRPASNQSVDERQRPRLRSTVHGRLARRVAFAAGDADDQCARGAVARTGHRLEHGPVLDSEQPRYSNRCRCGRLSASCCSMAMHGPIRSGRRSDPVSSRLPKAPSPGPTSASTFRRAANQTWWMASSPAAASSRISASPPRVDACSHRRTTFAVDARTARSR